MEMIKMIINRVCLPFKELSRTQSCNDFRILKASLVDKDVS